MDRHQGNVALLLLFVITTLVLFLVHVKSVPMNQWLSPHIATLTSEVSLRDTVENTDKTTSLLTYGANEQASEFTPQHRKGARVLILAYRR